MQFDGLASVGHSKERGSCFSHHGLWAPCRLSLPHSLAAFGPLVELSRHLWLVKIKSSGQCDQNSDPNRLRASDISPLRPEGRAPFSSSQGPASSCPSPLTCPSPVLGPDLDPCSHPRNAYFPPARIHSAPRWHPKTSERRETYNLTPSPSYAARHTRHGHLPAKLSSSPSSILWRPFP